MDELRYPIGQFVREGEISDPTLQDWIGQIRAAPDEMRAAVDGLTRGQLETPYRPGGWTLRQVVHHVPDSHLNCYVRFKWALTEEAPVIKAYDEVGWAGLADSRDGAVEVSLDFLEILHRRWVGLLESLSPDQWERSFVHPVSGPVTLRETVGSYAWHGRHHIAHVTTTRARESW